MIFKKIYIFLVIFFFSLILGLLILEATLRFYQFLGENSYLGVKPYKTTLKWVENPIIGKVFFAPNQKGWFVTPSFEYFNFIETNSFGFNDDEHNLNKPKDTFRILFLGDSFVASVQTSRDKTFFRQIEKQLNQESKSKKFETIALGLGDTGTAQQFLALKEIGIKYKPDLVIHMFLTANDIKNNSPTLMRDPYRPYFTLDSRGNLRLLPHKQYSKRPYADIKDIIKRSYLIEFLLSLRQSIQERNKNASLDYPVDYHVYDKSFSKDYQEAWGATQKLIVQSKKLVEESGGKYLLVTLANNEQVNKNVWEELKKTYPKLKEAKIDLEKPDKMIMEFCLENKVSCSQMLPTFKDYVSKNLNSPTHYKLDGHWNAVGTSIATNFLLQEIQNLKLLNYF